MTRGILTLAPFQLVGTNSAPLPEVHGRTRGLHGTWRRLVGTALALVLGLAGLSCKEGPTGPTAGTLKVKLTMPAANSGFDGAILFTVTGPTAPSDVGAGASLAKFHQQLGATTKYVVTGTLVTGATILTLDVEDTRQRYTATIQQVAAQNGYQLRPAPLTGYALAVTR